MKCAEVKPLLDLLIDNETGSVREAEVKNHLQNCRSCQNALKNLQIISRILKKPLPVSASANLDERVLRSFRIHQANKDLPVTTKTKKGFFGRIFVPVPVFALALAVFAIAVGAAYQFGKKSGINEISNDTGSKKMSKTATNQNPQIAGTNETPLIKYVEVPVTKIVRVPIVKTQQITRIVYKERTMKNSPSTNRLKENETFVAEDKNNRVLTQINLNGFQPVSELKVRITRNGETQ